ncbi:Transcriptional activator of fatty acid utilization [Oleoguttula sp. CCFEE 5521]
MLTEAADLPCPEGILLDQNEHGAVGQEHLQHGKVRCDAASLGVPCTNCVAFSIKCKIPTPKRKKTAGGKKESSRYVHAAAQGPDIPRSLSSHMLLHSERRESCAENDDLPPSAPQPGTTYHSVPAARPRDFPDTILSNSQAGMPETELSDTYADRQRFHNDTWAQYMKPKFARAPIKEAGRVAYLGESVNLSLLIQDQNGARDVVHYPLPENARGARARANELDNVEINILHQRGAFLLPPRALCDELVDAYFRWIAPICPVINRSKFMRQYRDAKNPPSVLLLQAILLAGSRVCSNYQLMDANGSTTPAAMTFYKRAKALYDANYEDDRVTIVQALILMGWYWEGPEGKATWNELTTTLQSDIAADVTKNVSYWSRVAMIVAQGSGMHRSVEDSQLSQADKRLWKRIWWTLFTRDRSVAVALGRPVTCNIEDSDVEMLSEDDFYDDEPDRPAEHAPNPIHVQFFINYVKLCEIMGLVLSQQYSMASKTRRNNALDLTYSDMALADWLQNCPPEVRTTLCLLHRAHIPPAGPEASARLNGFADETAYPSRTIAYQAAAMITAIVETLTLHDQIRHTPAFIVYSLFSALIMHVYQMRSSNQSIVSLTQQRTRTCMNALKDVSKVWLVAKMVHTLFEPILGTKMLEERLQGAPGRQQGTVKRNGHSRSHTKDITAEEPAEPQKRKFDDMELGYSKGPPAPQMSRKPSNNNISSHSQPHHPKRHPSKLMTLSWASLSNTRPITPFNGFYPGTRPDLFLHTRNSPKLSEDLWQNYQPDQLFPPEANGMFPLLSPQGILDPALRSVSQHVAPQMQQPPQHSQPLPSQQQQQQPPPMTQMTYPNDPNALAYTPNISSAGAGRGMESDHGTNASSGNGFGGNVAPTKLNIGDWFDFFGI